MVAASVLPCSLHSKLHMVESQELFAETLTGLVEANSPRHGNDCVDNQDTHEEIPANLSLVAIQYMHALNPGKRETGHRFQGFNFPRASWRDYATLPHVQVCNLWRSKTEQATNKAKQKH